MRYGPPGPPTHYGTQRGGKKNMFQSIFTFTIYVAFIVDKGWLFQKLSKLLGFSFWIVLKCQQVFQYCLNLSQINWIYLHKLEQRSPKSVMRGSWLFFSHTIGWYLTWEQRAEYLLPLRNFKWIEMPTPYKGVLWNVKELQRKLKRQSCGLVSWWISK